MTLDFAKIAEGDKDLTILDAALQYRDWGFSVIPVQKNKKPYIKWEPYQKEKASPEQIKQWWKKWPNANVALITGAISADLVVADADSAAGLDKLNELIPEGLQFPMAATPGNGYHLFFVSKNGLGNAARFIKDCDFRAEGGYAILPPSKGLHGKSYYWVPGHELLNDLIPPALPEAIQKALSNTKASTESRKPPEWQNDLAKGTTDGNRHGAMSQLIGRYITKGLTDEEILPLIEAIDAKNKPPLAQEESLLKFIQGVRNTDARKHGERHSIANKKPRGLILMELEKRFTATTDWLWRAHIPRGQPIICNGREGIGKTSIMMVSAKERKVLDCVNKMRSIGLTERFYVAQKSDGTFKFNFLRDSDVRELDSILADLEGPILAVYVDSIRGMSPLGDNDDTIGGVLHKVNALVCDKYRASLIYADHWGKGKKDDILDRNVGTTAKPAAVSAILSVIAKTKYTRDIVCAKTNIGEIPDLLSVKAGEQITIRQPHEESAETMATRAEAFLLELGAANETLPATEVYKLAEEQNIGADVLKKIKVTLGITSERSGPNESWFWHWPPI